jgi:hypothetical protein
MAVSSEVTCLVSVSGRLMFWWIMAATSATDMAVPRPNFHRSCAHQGEPAGASPELSCFAIRVNLD